MTPTDPSTPDETIDHASTPVPPGAETTGDFGPAATVDPPRPAGASAPTPDAPGLIGYEVGELIARGGMGAVYAGRDLSLDREVAIKTLLPTADAARFVTEAKVTARLAHPGVPPVHALGAVSDGVPFLAMKLVRGDTLAHQLAARPSPAADLSRFLQVVERVAEAVGFAHARGVVHRDLKPLNVMVGEFGEVQVMDWGLARVGPGDEPGAGGPAGDGDAGHTVAGAILGTPAYMAPEQARGEPVDARADVFALGGLLLGVLTGGPTFRASGVSDAVAQAAAGDTADALARLDACAADPELVSLTRRCLAAAPSDRPADGRAVAGALAGLRARAEERLGLAMAEAAAATARAAEQAKRRRQFVVAAALVTAVLAAGVVGTGVGLARARRAAEAEAAASAEAHRRLARVQANNQTLTSVFAELDVRKARTAGQSVEVALAERLVAAARQLDGDAAGDPGGAARVRERLAMSLLNLGRPGEALPLFEAARDALRAAEGDRSPDALSCANSAATCLSELGRLSEAVPLWEAIWRDQRDVLGADHPEALATAGNLALGYDELGRPERAMPIHREVVRARRDRLGADHANTLTAVNNLATTLCSLGEFAEAERLFADAGSRRSATLGADHPETLGSRINLAQCRLRLGRDAEAVAELEDVVRRQTARLGPDHPDTLTGAHNLAHALYQTGQAERAVPVWEDTLRRDTAALGADHPNTVSVARWLARAYAATRTTAKRVEVLERLVKTLRSAKSDAAALLPVALDELAFAHCEAGAFAKASALFRERRGLASPTQPDPRHAAGLAAAGSTLLAAGQFAEAEAVLRECLAIRARSAPGTWPVHNAESMLGAALVGLGRFAEAEPLLLAGRAGLVARRADLPPEARAKRLEESLARLVTLYERWGKPAEAQRWRREPAAPN